MSPTRISIRVMPRSPRNRIDGMRDGRLIVRVTAPPVDNAANEAVITLLAGDLGVPRGSIRVVSGANSRNKAVEVAGLTEAQLAKYF